MTIKLKHLFLITILLQGVSISYAQDVAQEINPPDYIKTIQFLGGEQKFNSTPIIKLGTPISISFDDVNGDEKDYYYKITHYNFDWTPSVLFKNEYMDGFDDIRIVNYENSFNTLTVYSNYRLSIPNEDTRRLKVSGNYMLEIYNDEDELVFTRKFIIYEQVATVKVNIKRSRNLKFIDTKQAVQFSINAGDYILRNPKNTVKTLVIQNNDIHRGITNLPPQFTIGNELSYKYDQEASFWGGNEFLFFDNKEIRAATANIRRIDLDEIYNNYLYTDIMRGNVIYTYNPDVNGAFVVRNIDAEDSSTEADYAWVHFTLQCYEPIGDSKIHVYGGFNNFQLNESTKMEYDQEKAVYYKKILFKQGFNNYKYVLVHKDGTIDPGFVSGNFDETENEYIVIPYYRAPGARYDRAIGVGVGNSRNITN